MAGRLAPFIELGVGFNHELTARENVVLNGVMMGLTPQETRDRLDAVIEFAELEEFVDLKLKNYSSGMLVRLAFSVMLRGRRRRAADRRGAGGRRRRLPAEVRRRLPRDESRRARRSSSSPTTMATVEDYCHRAMLIDGRRDRSTSATPPRSAASTCGSTSSAAARRGAAAVPERERGGAPARRLDRGRRRRPPTNVEHGEADPSAGRARDPARDAGAGRRLHRSPTPTASASSSSGRIERDDGSPTLPPGERVKVGAELDNPLVPGRYFVHCGINRGRRRDRPLRPQRGRLRRLRRRGPVARHGPPSPRDRGDAWRAGSG